MQTNDAGIELTTLEDGRARIFAAVDSRDWWILPWVTPAAAPLSIAIETRFYDGPANADFEAILLPFLECPAICLMHKRRMSVGDLRILLVDIGGEWKPDQIVGDRDILIPGIRDDSSPLYAVACRLLHWIRTGETG